MSFGAFAEYTVIPARTAMPVPAVKAEYIPFLVSGLTASISLDKDIGCDRPINYTNKKLKDVLKAEYKKGIDVVYETIGGDVFDTCISNLAVKGRMIVIGYIESYKDDVGFIPPKKAALVQPIVLSKSASVRGFLMNHYMSLWPEHLGKLVQMYERGEIASTVDNGKYSPEGPFRGVDSVAHAVDYLYSKKSVGKIIVEFPPSPKSQL